MNITEFTKKFEEVFDDEVVLTSETYFKELDEWSSLTVLSIIAFAEENFDVILTGKDIREVETVQDIFELINSKK